MKLSNETIDVLKNFSSINQSIAIAADFAKAANESLKSLSIGQHAQTPLIDALTSAARFSAERQI